MCRRPNWTFTGEFSIFGFFSLWLVPTLLCLCQPCHGFNWQRKVISDLSHCGWSTPTVSAGNAESTHSREITVKMDAPHFCRSSVFGCRSSIVFLRSSVIIRLSSSVGRPSWSVASVVIRRSLIVGRLQSSVDRSVGRSVVIRLPFVVRHLLFVMFHPSFATLVHCAPFIVRHGCRWTAGHTFAIPSSVVRLTLSGVRPPRSVTRPLLSAVRRPPSINLERGPPSIVHRRSLDGG